MNNRMIPTAKDFFNKQTPHVCNTLAYLKFYYKDIFCDIYHNSSRKFHPHIPSDKTRFELFFTEEYPTRAK